MSPYLNNGLITTNLRHFEKFPRSKYDPGKTEFSWYQIYFVLAIFKHWNSTRFKECVNVIYFVQIDLYNEHEKKVFSKVSKSTEDAYFGFNGTH